LALATQAASTIGAAKFITWAQTQPIAALTHDTVQGWIAALRMAGCKSGSINTWLSGLRASAAQQAIDDLMAQGAGERAARRRVSRVLAHNRPSVTNHYASWCCCRNMR
jgi:hypothetical protein